MAKSFRVRILSWEIVPVLSSKELSEMPQEAIIPSNFVIKP